MKATVKKTRRLTLHKGTSHKFYTIRLLKSKTRYYLETSHGRIGGYARANAPVVRGYQKKQLRPLGGDLPMALAIYRKVVASKKSRGYC